MQRLRRILTWILLIFIAGAVVMIFRPREQVILPDDGLCVLFWHSETRCPSCRRMEELLLQTLQNYDDLHLFLLEYDVLAYQSLARQFNVGTPTIILVERKDRQDVRVQDLTDKISHDLDDEPAFVEMLQKELSAFIKGCVKL
jgi:thiol-disulfide isomerase/thioredoxin